MSTLLRAGLAALLVLASSACAQQSRVVGTVPAADASATGVLEVSSGRSVLGSSSGLTTGPRPARVTLQRGGELQLCQGSSARLTGASASTPGNPLVVGLDRGALELRLTLTPVDAVMTPDLRITSANPKSSPLDLALRVTGNGDTCLDNRGKKSPALNVTDSFGTGTYRLKPGQRALFEHGSLREVVDREQGPCGCPAPGGTSVAGGKGQFPFPEAVSEGLADPTPAPPETPGGTHTQVSSTLNAEPGAEPSAPAPAGQTSSSSPASAPEDKAGFFGSVGRFFRHLFGR